MSHGPILIVPDLRKPFEVLCDASGDCVGAVINQENHAVAYESRRLRDAELHASIYEKELMAVVHALSVWKHYLLGADFVIKTDHQSLRYFLSQRKLSEKQMRWANFLSMFHFQILHTSGNKNVVADALSRRPKVNAVTSIYHQELESLPEMYPADSDFTTIWQELNNGNFIPSYSLRDGYLYHHHAICVAGPLRNKVMEEAHASPYAGHRGITPTTQALERYFYWPTLRTDIEKYVRECIVCQKVKYDRHKVAGLLQPLPVPRTPWESITMDFITGLPKTQNGNDAIWTIIDRFSKQAHFIPVRKTIKPEHMAKVFLAQIFKHHGMPKTIVSDRDPRMTSLFWRALFENLGTKLDFSSAYHPETDGQSEVTNSTVLDLLKCYVSDRQTDWEKFLPLVEFAYNNTIHSSTGKAPFEVIYGKPNLPPILLTKDKIFAADEFVRDLDTAYGQVRHAIQRSQDKQKRAADKHRRDQPLNLGQLVLLRFQKARLKKQSGQQGKVVKLSNRYYGPFRIVEKVNDVTFRLDLPPTWNIHNAFHVSLLRPYVGDPPAEPIHEDPPEVQEAEELLTPEQILHHQERQLKSGTVHRKYLVKFKNYPILDAQWMSESDLESHSSILNSYLDALQLRTTV